MLNRMQLTGFPLDLIPFPPRHLDVISQTPLVATTAQVPHDPDTLFSIPFLPLSLLRQNAMQVDTRPLAPPSRNLVDGRRKPFPHSTRARSPLRLCG